MPGDIAQSTARPFPKLSRRVSDLQSIVREHTARNPTPQELVASLSEAGMDVELENVPSGGEPLVRLRDGDLALLFNAADGTLAIVDVRRSAA